MIGSGAASATSHQFFYDGEFSHLIYSLDTLDVNAGDIINIDGYQESTNPDYPTVRINYVFVEKDSTSTPDDDNLITASVTYKGTGYYNHDFSIAESTWFAQLRMWNYENYDGSNKNKTVRSYGTATVK